LRFRLGEMEIMVTTTTLAMCSVMRKMILLLEMVVKSQEVRDNKDRLIPLILKLTMRMKPI